MAKTKTKEKTGTWVVIECFGGMETACICMNENGDGLNMLFDSEEKAQMYAIEQCQEGMAVQID